MNQQVFCGNNIELLKSYPDNYFDAVVTDPPYGLGKEPDANEMLKVWIETGYLEVNGSGFMGKEWDAFVPQPIFWKEVFRVLKHGGHVLSFFGTRTYDWGVMAIRLAGFEVRDCIQWLYGSGFPKSHNIGKNIEKIKVGGISNLKQVGTKKGIKVETGTQGFSYSKEYVAGKSMGGKQISGEIPIYEITNEWEGWGSALKPAVEPIVLARKPLEKGLSIAENVLKWGTGGINIDGCRVSVDPAKDDMLREVSRKERQSETWQRSGFKNENNSFTGVRADGRFPANLILTHHPECECIGLKKVGNGKEGGYNYEGNVYEVEGFVPNNSPIANSNYGQELAEDWNCHEDCPIKIMDEQSGILKSGDMNGEYFGFGKHGIYGKAGKTIATSYGDTGGASRFFYCAKASKSERNQGLNGFEEKQSVGGGGGIGDYIEDVNSASGKYGSEKAPNKNFHPTVKPVALMRYLVRLITPPNGIVLDPFNGSGTTGIACKFEGFSYVGLEQDEEYCKISIARINNAVEEEDEKLQIIKDSDEPDIQNQLSLF